MSWKLSELDIREYRECGVTVVRNALTPEQVETLRRGIDRAFQNSDADFNCTEKDSARLKKFERFPSYEDHPEYKEIIFHSDLPKIAALLTGSRTIRLHHEQIHVEVPRLEVRTPWHEDNLFYNVDSNQSLTMFVPVDPVPKRSAKFVLGSHKWPSSMPNWLRRRFASDLPEEVVPEPPDVDGRRREMPVVSWALEPGDALVFNFHTLHFLNTATALRRAMSVRYLGDDAVYAPRQWTTFPCFPQLEKEPEALKAGDPVTHPAFPVVYRCEGKL